MDFGRGAFIGQFLRMRPSLTPSRLFTGDFGGLPDFDVLPDFELFGVLLPLPDDDVDDPLLLVFVPLEAFDAGGIMSSKL